MKKMSMSNWSKNEEDFHPLMDELYYKAVGGGYRDAPFLFASRQSVAASLARTHLFQEILNVKGSIVECGCHQGNNLFLFYHLSSILEPYAFNRKIIGFDSFGGFRSQKDYENVNAKDFSDTNYELLIALKKIHDLNRPIGHIEKIELIKGDAVQTIPLWKSQNEHALIALLYLDFDIYEPTKVALENLFELVVKGGLVVFDELNAQKFPGETRIFKEFFGKAKLRKLPFEPWLSFFYVE